MLYWFQQYVVWGFFSVFFEAGLSRLHLLVLLLKAARPIAAAGEAIRVHCVPPHHGAAVPV